MHRVHHFKTEDSGDVYDQTQYRDDIHMGDLLVVHVEKIVGFLFSAWPTAVTKNHGRLHGFEPGVTPESLTLNNKEEEHYRDSFREALQLATELGWEI
jgi:hypothetical protein